MTTSKISEIKQRLDAMPAKDRRALLLLTLFVAAVILIYAVMLPAHRYANDAAELHQQRAEILAWMQSNESEARKLQAQPTTNTNTSGQSLLSLATQHAQSNNLSFKRFEPFGEGGLRVWLDNASFNSLLQWLTTLQQKNGVLVKQVSIDRATQTGRVSAKLELVLP
ncbi:MAG: type II secretion system protein M [Pseudomonadales bacterium]